MDIIKMKLINISFITVTVLIRNLVHSEDTCKKTSSCSCKFSNGEVIDLSELGNNDNTPRFADEPDPKSNADLYSWNPCSSFTEGDCKNVAICNIHNNIPNAEYFPLGNQDSATFSTIEQVTKLTYTYQGTGGASRTAAITLTCDQSQTDGFVSKGEDSAGSGKYFFELQTKYACVKSGGSSGGSLSAGTIILIGLLCIACVYLAVGIIIQIFVKKASGKEMIPNYTFWTSFPGLVKDGTVFVITRGKRKTYSSI